MTTTEAAGAAGLILSGLNIVGTLFTWLWKINRIEFRVNELWTEQEKVREDQRTAWQFQMQRGMHEALEKGILKQNSPITVPDEIAEVFEPILPPMIEWVRSISEEVRRDDVRLTLEIQKQFGRIIVDVVCRTLGIHEGACLQAAAVLLRSRVQKQMEPNI